jgi:hypothetical protein
MHLSFTGFRLMLIALAGVMNQQCSTIGGPNLPLRTADRVATVEPLAELEKCLNHFVREGIGIHRIFCTL